MHTPLGACSFWFAFAQKGTQLVCSRTARHGQPKRGKWGALGDVWSERAADVD